MFVKLINLNINLKKFNQICCCKCIKNDVYIFQVCKLRIIKRRLYRNSIKRIDIEKGFNLF